VKNHGLLSAMSGLGLPGPTILRRLVLSKTIERFVGGELFLVLVMMLADLFSSMWRFLALDASIWDILRWVAAGVPAHLAEVLPVAFLFGITLTLAEMHADGELLVVCGSGISVQSLCLPIVLFSLALAAGMFFSGDALTIPSSIRRDNLYRQMTGQKGQGGQVTDIAILARGGLVVYRASYYDSAAKKLVDVDIVERDEKGKTTRRILAPYAEWKESVWSFANARIFFIGSTGEWTETYEKRLSEAGIDEPPKSFENLKEKSAQMKRGELAAYIDFLRGSGLPTAEALAEYYKRFAFILTPLIVCGLSVAFAGLFRKNSLLMSLLFSLATATVYYVAQMLGALAAKTGWISPFWGIWAITLAFLLAAVAGYFKART
jgi:lipopolysaccharide export system permease protein